MRSRMEGQRASKPCIAEASPWQKTSGARLAGFAVGLAVFLTLLEPVMILVMGGVVLIIVLAILLPIIEINQLVH